MPEVELYFDGISWCDSIGVFTNSKLTEFYDPGQTTVEIIFNGYKREWNFATKTLGSCVSC